MNRSRTSQCTLILFVTFELPDFKLHVFSRFFKAEKSHATPRLRRGSTGVSPPLLFKTGSDGTDWVRIKSDPSGANGWRAGPREGETRPYGTVGRVAHAAPRAMAPRRAPEWRRSLRDWGAAVGRWGSCYAPAGSCDYGAIAQTGGRRGSVAGGGVDIQCHAPHRPHSWLLEPARARRQVPTFPMGLQGPLQTSGRTPRGHTWHLGARARPRSGPGYWMCWHGSTTFVPRGPGAGSSRRGALR